MWLSRKLSQHEMQDVASAQDGTVTVEGGELAVFSSGEKREVKTAAPGGYEWQPKKGEDVLVVRGGTFGEEAYAVGAVVAYLSPWIAPLVGISVSALAYIALTRLSKRQPAADSVAEQ